MVLTNLLKSGIEHMMGNKKEKFMQHEEKRIIIVLIWLCLVLVLGKYLWNEYAVKCVTIINPLKSVWQLIGIIILVDLIYPRCC